MKKVDVPISWQIANALLGLLVWMFPVPSYAKSLYDLSCTGNIRATVDAPEYTLIKRLTLKDRLLAVEVKYGLRDYALQEHRASNILRADGVGYALDDKPVTGLKVAQPLTSATIKLSFFKLHPGKHRLTLGIVDDTGELYQANSYCFTVPDNFSLKGNLYL